MNMKPKTAGTTQSPMLHSVSLDVLSHCGEVAGLFASLSHVTRLKILCLLMTGEQRVSALTQFCEVSQPAMSQFLQRMKKDGLVEGRRDGTEVFYRIADPRLVRLLGATRDIYVGS